MQVLNAVIVETNERLNAGATPQEVIEELTDVQQMINKMLQDLINEAKKQHGYSPSHIYSAQLRAIEEYQGLDWMATPVKEATAA